ncbi:MAG: hypothetical protein L6R38_009196 [Xanthoria sp. 2 TBL-2021]|nr:MAG: hypothetical protein L6R38_009196 [Xanthoria sp. 2 TBL-2021]
MADPHAESEGTFTGPAETHTFNGILFDMDGTIVDSTDAIIKHWHKIGKELGVDPSVILETSHGRRSIDTLALYDQGKANWDYVSHIEGLIPKEYGADAVEIPGARGLLASLEHINARWAIVTSGTRPLVTGWLDVMRLPHPHNLVVAEDVSAGKPAPDCYRLGIDRVGLTAEGSRAAVLVEDSPAGILAGKAAGCQVIGLATTHSIEQIRQSGADWIVQDLQSVTLLSKVVGVHGQIQIEIRHALQR